MGNLTAANIWAIVAGVAAAVVLLVNAWEKLMTVIHAVKAPGAAQNDRLAQLEDSVKVSTGPAQRKKGAPKRPCKHLFFARPESIFNQI